MCATNLSCLFICFISPFIVYRFILGIYSLLHSLLIVALEIESLGKLVNIVHLKIFQIKLIARYNRKGGKNLTLDGETSANPHDDMIPHSPDHDDKDSEVSDVASLNSLDNDGLDKVIDLSHGPSNDPTEDENVTIDSIVDTEYNEEEPSQTLPPVEKKLSNLLTKWLRIVPSRDKVKELFKQCMLPTNLEGLKPVRINDLLYEKLPFNYKVNDQKLRGITFFARGLGPLASIWDQLLKFESVLLNSDGGHSTKVVVDNAKLTVRDSTLDITEIRCSLAHSLRLLSAGHSILLDRQKGQLKSFFDPRFHYLLKSSNPVTTELLGDNVDVKIAESTKNSEAAQKLQVKRAVSNFRGNTYRGNASRHPFYKHTFDKKQQMSAPYHGGFNSGFPAERGRFQRAHVHSNSNNFTWAATRYLCRR